MATLTQLEYIVAVDKLRHFGRAAKECNVSQPSLSAQIQKVEEEQDIILFDRSKKPILPTDLGKKFIQQAQVILKEHSRLFDLKSASGTIRGHFHLGVIPSLSPYLLPRFIESFSNKYPHVQLQVSEYKTDDIVHKLYDDELDGGLLVTPLYDDKIIERALFLEPFFVFASMGHSLLKKKIVKESDLTQDDIWLLDEGHCFREQVIRFCSLDRKHRVLPNIKFSSGSLETLMNLIRKGTGYTLVPQLATENLTDSEFKKYIRSFSKPVPTREVSLVHSRSFLKEDIISALVDSVTHNLPNEITNLKTTQTQVIDI